MRAAFKTNAETWDQFKKCRALAVSKDSATFLLDYYNSKGDLADAIFLDSEGFARISNEPVRSAAEYRKIDRFYWRKAQSEYRSRQQAA